MPKHDRDGTKDVWRTRIERALAELRGIPYERESSDRGGEHGNERSQAGKAD